MELSEPTSLAKGSGHYLSAHSIERDRFSQTNDSPVDDLSNTFLESRRDATAVLFPPRLQNESELTPTTESCERRRPDEANHPRLAPMASTLIGKTVKPFLREHIPTLYAPVGNQGNAEATAHKDPNSKYCYRHSPDAKCRRAADESKMAMIQRDLDHLPPADQQAITHVWSLFSAAPSKHRNLMIQGIITQCCFPQLSIVAREVQEQLKIDFLQALPAEISYKILAYLDAASLCRAAQVSRQWKALADDDVVWHVICSQHIDRKCARCGWKLPLLERKRLRDWSRHHDQAQSAKRDAQAALVDSSMQEPPLLPAPNTQRSPSPAKREGSVMDEPAPSGTKRRRLDRAGSEKTSLVVHRPEAQRSSSRPWKDVYRQSHRVGSNWKHGRGSVNVIRGHTNGVTALQILDDRWMATGSYDASIKIFDLQTGAELRELVGHTQGIRSLQFDDSKLISGSLDETIKVWDWHTGECISTLQCHTDGVISVHFDGEYLASGSKDHTAKIFNFKTHQTFTLKGHGDWVNQVRVDSLSRTVFTASDDCVIKLWDLDTKRCIKTFEGHVGHVQQVLPLPADFEPDDDPLVSGMALDNIDTASDASGRSNGRASPALAAPPASLPDHDSSGQQRPQLDDESLRAAYGPTFVDEPGRALPPRYILTGSLDSTVRLFDTATARCERTFFGHLEGIWGLAGDALRVVTGANDAMVKVWEPRSGKCERTFTGHRGPVTCVALSDSRMASGGEDGEVRLYNFMDAHGAEVEFGTPS